ncbi:uncharacterized protein KY384_001633 [Bacidia gigantensis]|uniref:uncharacterized protein n=1 Tax=Bacidia gigantensis TaxID=2732470 RepID=UPI001D0454E8|nr:uncharacterized protein KY384_001633 [Bacidia gigantensis]KAG8533892.1 hypothetical protein KY384_001633 [Bacidia gigantensis]
MAGLNEVLGLFQSDDLRGILSHEVKEIDEVNRSESQDTRSTGIAKSDARHLNYTLPANATANDGVQVRVTGSSRSISAPSEYLMILRLMVNLARSDYTASTNKHIVYQDEELRFSFEYQLSIYDPRKSMVKNSDVVRTLKSIAQNMRDRRLYPEWNAQFFVNEPSFGVLATLELKPDERGVNMI